MADKTCKIYPRNGAQFISGILPRRKRIEYPCKINLNQAELRRCLSYATVYEEVDGKDVLLTLRNFTADNTDAEAATDVPDTELHDYTKDETVEEEKKVESTPVAQSETTANTTRAAQFRYTKPAPTTTEEEDEEESDI